MDDDPLVALAEQHRELADILAALSADDWRRPSRCAGWTISDVVLHLAQTDEMALASLRGTLTETTERLMAGMTRPESASDGATVDDLVEALVAHERDQPVDAIHGRWVRGVELLRTELAVSEPHRRVPWVAGEMSVRTLATTRLAETWIHTGDIAEALGIVLLPSDRLWLIARLAWRTLPYAFAKAGRPLAGPVQLLRGPFGDTWEFRPDRDPVTTISGDADDLCAVAARRVDPSRTTLVGDGPDGAAVLELVRTYA